MIGNELNIFSVYLQIMESNTESKKIVVKQIGKHFRLVDIQIFDKFSESESETKSRSKKNKHFAFTHTRVIYYEGINVQ